MKKNFLWIALALSATLAFTNCKKSEDTTPATPEIAVADANGMVERFNFDGNLNGVRRTNVTFSNPNNATVTGTDRRGNANRALVVPANASLTIEGLPLVTGNGSRTIFCWVHPNAVQGSHGFTKPFVGYGSYSTARGQAFGLDYTDGALGGYIDGDFVYEAYNFYNRTSIGCSWVPIAIVYNQSTNKLTSYLWGDKTEKTPTRTINTTGTTLRIGMYPDNTKGGTFMIDDIMIYNRALTDAEIQTLSNDTPCS